LGELFRQALNIKKYKPAATSTAPEKQAASPRIDENAPDHGPICPNCGAEMILRTTGRGPNAGKQFYGCPNYPSCRETLPIA
jgi:ssDNA-binding Zn-finger/Zn-ribbon topoisomerase 1